MYRTSILTAVAIFGACSISSAQSSLFQGAVEGRFANPVGGTVFGSGTNELLFDGSPVGRLNFTAAPNYSAASVPFLLGKIDFLASGDMPTQFTFVVGLDAKTNSGETARVLFCPDIPLMESSEPGFNEKILSFGPGQSFTTDFDGTPFTFSFAGVSSDPTIGDDSLRTTFSAVVDGELTSGYLWGQLTPDPTTSASKEHEQHYCEPGPPAEVPEPATVVLLAGGFVALLGYRQRKNRRPELTPVN